MAIRSLEQIIEEAETFVRNANGRINLQIGDVFKDAVIDAPAQEFAKEYILIDFVRNLQSVDGLLSMLSDTDFKSSLMTVLEISANEVDELLKVSVDDFVGNYDIIREPSSFTTGLVRFLRTSAGTMTIPLGQTVKTSGTVIKTYATTVAIVAQVAVLDPLTGLYFVEVPVEAEVAGTNGNTEPDTINTIFPAIPDASSVTNPLRFTNGVNEESNESLLGRARLSWKGRNVNTFAGYKLLALKQVGIIDALVLNSLDPLMLRGLGAVDLYILGEDATTAIDVIAYNGVSIVLAHQPVLVVTSVIGTITYTPGVHYNVVKDTGTQAKSILGQDKIVWILPPVIGELLTISYSYDARPKQFQDVLALDENHVVDADVLVKASTEILIDIQMKLVIFPSFSTSVVQAAVLAAVQAHFDAKLLDEDANQSDVIGIVEGIEGVDRVILPLTQFSITGGAGAADVVIAKNQYARLNLLTFVP